MHDTEEIRADLHRGLAALIDYQTYISSQAPDSATAATPDNIRTVLWALLVELGELSNEMNVKPWRDTGFTAPRAVKETTDVLAFLGLFLHYLEERGVAVSDLIDQYFATSAANLGRFAEEKMRRAMAEVSC